MSRRPQIHMLQGRPLTLLLRRSPRARHLRLAVSRRLGVEVVMPRWATGRDVARLLDEQAGWLALQATRHDV